MRARIVVRSSTAVAGLAALLCAPAATAVDFSLDWTGDFAAVAQGGLQQGAHHLGLVDLGAGSAFQWLGGREAEWHVTVQHTYGGGFSEHWVGDLQVVSNADADHGIRLLEAWVEGEVADGWAVGAGKYDFNSDFDAIDSGALFLSSSQGIGPDISQSGAAGPSIFPHTAVGVHVHASSGGGNSLRAAVLDADSLDANRGGPMYAFEYRHDRATTRFVLGSWGYGGEKPRIDDPAQTAREYGVYASVEHHFTERLAGYLRVGMANPAVEQVGRYFGGGIVHTGGLLPQVEDSIGFAVGMARNGSDYRQAMRADGIATDAAEYALEATWRIPLGEHFALQPDLQYVIHPGTDPTLDDALVFILRVEAGL